MSLPNAAFARGASIYGHRIIREAQPATWPLGEVERQTAEYKLFRSLALVALLDVLLMLLLLLLGQPWSPQRAALSLLVGVGAAVRFNFLIHWTYRLAFELYALAVRGGVKSAL